MTRCLLCKRERAKSSTLCRYHQLARKNIESAYPEWRHAYGEMAWKQYLKEVERNPQTGHWAKEVAALLAKEAPD